MCRQRKSLVALAAIFGVIQSVLWTAGTVLALLVYYCAIPVAPYEDKSDFFRVTLVKLYFEGPKCTLDGSYLGKFNEDYKNSITLLGKDMIVFVMIAYAILNVVYFFLSIGLYLRHKRQKKRFFALGWSLTTLILCATDVLLTYGLVMDFINLMDYILEYAETNQIEGTLLGGLPFIPLLVAIISSRFVLLWLWNLYFGIYVFCIGLCGNTPREEPVQVSTEVKTLDHSQLQPKLGENESEKVVEKLETKFEENMEVPQEPKGLMKEKEDEDENASVGHLSGTKFDIRSHPEYAEYIRSMEAVTRFPSESNSMWCHVSPTGISFYPDSHSKVPQATNEGYVGDEEVETSNRKVPRFDHDLKNFEAGQRKIKVTRPPVGKPVSIPVPPPLPKLESCNC